MSKPQDFFPYRGNKLYAESVSVEKIAERVGTPVYVYSANALLSGLKELQAGLQGLDHVICFAVKSNSNVALLRLLGEAGAGVDLVSGGELFRAELAQIPADRVVFSGVGKTPGEMASALEYAGHGIFSFNAESVEELQTLSAVASRLGKTAQVALRFNPDVNPKTHPYISTGLKKNKFGMSKTEILAVARNVRTYPGIALCGVSIHIGSQLLDLTPLEEAFKRARELKDELDRILPQPIRYMDLGGGLGITYKDEKSPSIDKYCKLVHRYFGAKSGLKNPVRILLEPGRRISGNAGILLTEVLYRKPRKEKDFLIVDAAMNDLLRPSLYGSYHAVLPARKARSGMRKTDVVGPVCETGDCFARDRKLPASLAQGDLLALLSAGAYGFVMSGNYNSRPRAPEVLVEGSRFRVIRERETYEDLVRGETIE